MTEAEFGPKTIRPSSLTTASDCMRRFAVNHLANQISEAGYSLKSPGVVHVGAAVGSGVHAAAQYTMSAKRADGTMGNASEAMDRAQAEFKERTRLGITWDTVTGDLSTAQRQLQRMTMSYRSHLAPDSVPVLVEERLEAELPDGWRLSGQIDLMTGNPHDQLEDLKTGARQRSNAVQYGAYALLVRAHGFALRGIEERFVKRVALAKEQPPPLATPVPLEPATQETWELLREIPRAAEEFERRVHDPHGESAPLAFRANPASVLCSPKFCRAHGTAFCRAHR